MNALWNNLLTHKSVTNLLILLTVAYGAFSLFSIRRESAPEVRVPYAIVTTSLPGASPTDVESLITNKIERAVGDVENIKKMTSSSRESVSVVAIEFEASADIDASLQKVRDAVATVRGDLPDDASEPTVADVNFSDQPIIIASVSSDLAPSEFKAFTDSVRDTLERVQGVSRVTVSGVRAPEVTVVARQTALALHNLSLSEVVQAISLQNAELPVGSLTNNNATLPVALKSALTDMYSVATLPITTRSGETLLLQDIALVSDGVEDVSTISRVSYDGAPAQQAATLSVYKQRGSDITKTVAQVEATLAEIEKAHPGVVTQISYNAGADIKKDLTKLSRTGIEATVLVVLSLFATLGWREAVVAGLSIPLSILLSFIALKETGNTLNFISLFSLILSIGILVDSAIVVTEAIHVNMRRGLRPLLAARTALREYASPLTGGTLTTIAVFLPLFTISGVTGQFIQSIPFTVIFVLIASLIVALGFTPLLAARWCSPSEKASRVEVAQEVYAEKLREWYRTHITSLLDNRRQKLFFVWGLVGSFVLALLLPIVGLVQTTFFQQSDVNWIYLEIEEVPGTPIEKTDLTTRAVEETLAGIPEISSYAVAVGRGSSFSENPQSGPRFASIDITLTDAEERTRTSTEIVEDIQNRVRTFTSSSVRVYQPNNGPPSGAPVVATFEGDDLGTLKSVAQKAEKILTETPGTRSVQSDLSASSIEYEVGIDRLKASELGLSPLVIAQTLRTATYGTEATTIKKERIPFVW
jgi:multidrug efflux pump subunit AcrB